MSDLQDGWYKCTNGGGDAVVYRIVNNRLRIGMTVYHVNHLRAAGHVLERVELLDAQLLPVPIDDIKKMLLFYESELDHRPEARLLVRRVQAWLDGLPKESKVSE